MAKTETFRPSVSTYRFGSLPEVFKLANTQKAVYTPPAIDSNLVNQYMRSERHNIGLYPDEQRLKEILSQGVKMLIPRQYLHGRQDSNSYGKRKRELVEGHLFQKGVEFLINEPIIACALSARDGLQMVVVDGHHRVRYSSAFGIKNIPSVIYSPQQLVEAFNLRNSTHFDANSLTEQLRNEVNQAYSSFRNLDPRKLPKIVTGFSTIQDLPFQRF